MGLVLIDLEFRAEDAFKIRMPDTWYERVGIHTAGDDATLAQFHGLLLELCREQNVDPPADSWNVLFEIVADATGIKQKHLTPGTWLIKDIAPNG